jgi:hypothetical protein
MKMTVNEGLRLVAGVFILLSLILGWLWHWAWFLFTAFVGANLLQSAFTRWCPMMLILEKLGFQSEEGTPQKAPRGESTP